MSVAQLEARLAELASETDTTMGQTFRARGAKLESLTRRLEQLEEETKVVEAQLAAAKAGGGAPIKVTTTAPTPAPVPAFSANKLGDPYAALSSPALARPPVGGQYAASPAISRPPAVAVGGQYAASPAVSRPPAVAAAAANPYATNPYASSPAPLRPVLPAAAAAVAVNPYSASPALSRPPEYGFSSSPMPQRPAPTPVVASSPMPQRPPPTLSAPAPVPVKAFSAPAPQRPPPRLVEDARKALQAKKADFEARLASAAAGISQLQNLRVFLDRKAQELAERIKSVKDREKMLHYQLNKDDVVRAQAMVRRWLLRRRDPTRMTADMLLRTIRDYKDSDLAKDAKHRWQALVEIYNSEKTYHASLEVLITHYMRPIEAASQQPHSCIEPAQSLLIFNTLDAIAAYSSKMVERLAYATVSMTKSEKMGDVFLQMIPTMALYERYYIGFEDSLSTLKKLYKEKRFNDLLAQCKKASNVQLSLEQLLIMPVQRLPRYSILLEALLKHTPDIHTDKPSLLEALNRVKAVLSGINSKAKEHETVGAVVRIANQVLNLPAGFQLATANRRFVRSDLIIFVVQGRIVTRRKAMYCFLFNDMLMRTKQKRGVDDQYEFREFIPLDIGSKVVELPDDTKVTNGFAIVRGETQWKFMTDSAAKKESWIESVKEVLTPPPSLPAAGGSVVAAAPSIAAVLAKGPKTPANAVVPAKKPIVPVAAAAPPAATAAAAAAAAPSAAIAASSSPGWDSVAVPLVAWPVEKDVLAPPNVFVPVKGNSFEYGGAAMQLPEVFDSHLRTPYFEKYLKFRPHSIYVGTFNGKPLLVVLERATAPADSSSAAAAAAAAASPESSLLFAMVVSPTGDVRFSFSGGAAQAEAELKKRDLPLRLRDFVRIPSDHPKAPMVQDALIKFENSRIVSAYKFGVIPWNDGQTEDEAFGNKASPAFESFLELLGPRIKLKGWTKFRGGLNVQTNLTGEESIFVETHGFSVMLHVSTLLPFNPADKQQLERKRHLGNDVVIVVFREKGDVPLDVSQFHSQFNHVFIVVTPVGGNKGFRVGVACKPGVAMFGPRIPPSGIVPANAIGKWLLAKMINGERAAMHAKDFSTKEVKTHAAQLQALVDSVVSGKAAPQRGELRIGGGANSSGAGSGGAVDPDDPDELQRRLGELKTRERTAVASLDGLRKLSTFYEKDPKAKAESDAKIGELEKEHAQLKAQIATIETKVKNKAVSTVARVTLSGKSDAEKQSLIASFQAQVTQQERTIAQLEKLLGFYAKDPSGAASTKAQLQKEQETLASLKERVAELQNSLQPEPAATETDEYEDEDDDTFNVDFLSAALRTVSNSSSTDTSGTGGGGSAATANDNNNPINLDALSRALGGGSIDTLKSTLLDLDLGDNDEPDDDAAAAAAAAAATTASKDVAATLLEKYETMQKGDRVWVLSEEGEWAFVQGERGECWVPKSSIQRD